LLIFPFAYVIGGYKSTLEGLTTLWEEKELDVDLLMIIAALGAASLAFWQREYFLLVDGAILILIFALSGTLETIVMQRTEKNIRALMSLTPDLVRVIVQGKEQQLPIEKVQVEDIVLVKPGEQIPVDGLIIEGNSTVNQAPITGESFPVEKIPGDEVFAGTLNGSGVLHLKVHRPLESSLLQRVIQLVEKAQTEAPASQQFIERFERGYAKIIVIIGLILGILPPFILGWDWEKTIYQALIFFVVASPCALMASIMPTLLSGIAKGARQGILFKNGAQLEQIGKIKAIAFDKTGTLTTGKLKVTEIIPASQYSEREVLQIAASLEAYSEHPISEAIMLTAKNKKIEGEKAVNVQAKVGQGIVGEVAGKQINLGKLSFIKSQINNLNPELLSTSDLLEREGKSVIWVVQNQEILGIIAVADTLRPEAEKLVSQLKQLGIEEIVMLTGDNQITANSVGKAVGIEKVYADLLPEDKLAIIENLRKKYKIVAMVGDGINDAPALAMATVGIAMGGAENDVALETADIILMTNNLGKLSQAIELSRRANLIVRQNITFALFFIFLLLTANFFGNINMPIGVIGHEGSTLLVTLSGLRLLR
jgi:Cd2+/Zn2+-exporting ATPase